MLTPNEITERKFDKVMVWGYDMNAVDSFLEAVSADYAHIYKENIALKNKMKVLVSKIEEYRAVDESMREALANAKKLAAEITENAQRESEALLTAARAQAASLREEAQAEATACRETAQAEAAKAREDSLTLAEKYRTEAKDENEALLASYKKQIATEEMRLETAKTNVQAFIDKSIALYRQELDVLTSLREQEFSYEITTPVKVEIAEPAPVVVKEEPAPVIATPAQAPVIEAPAPAPTPVAKPVVAEEPVQAEEEEELILPDTITLPDLPPIPSAKPAAAPAAPTPAPQPKPAKHVYEVDTDDEDEEEDEFVKPAKRRLNEAVATKRAAKYSAREEDNEETIVLTPKPRFEFSNLQFGDKYNPSDKKRK